MPNCANTNCQFHDTEKPQNCRVIRVSDIPVEACEEFRPDLVTYRYYHKGQLYESSNNFIPASDAGKPIDGYAGKPKTQTEPEIQRRGACLEKALAVINGERLSTHGTPEDSFGLIARYWTVYLEQEVSDLGVLVIGPRQVAEMMVLFKLARMSGQEPTIDNYIDAAGYIGIAGDMMEDSK